MGKFNKMRGKFMKKVLMFLMISFTLVVIGCNRVDDDDRLYVVTTTTMLADLVREIGGEHVRVEYLMGPGVDPHLYQATAGDINRMSRADLVVFNGLDLEGKMGQVFANLEKTRPILEITKYMNEENFILEEDDDDHFDPHVWFDVSLWMEVAEIVRDKLIEIDAENEASYRENFEAYLVELEALDAYVRERVEELPEEKRILVTAHDAFGYFGEAYGFIVKAIQGISTEDEAGISDINKLAEFIVEHQVKAIFIETSIPENSILALQAAVRARGFDVVIGGELYSDSLGSKGTEQETYIGTFKHNIDTIIDALK